MTQKTRLPEGVLPLLLVLVITAFFMMINETSISVALPHIMEDFSVTASTAQWLLTGVMLTMAILMPATGWILDRFSTRAVFLFAVGSFFAGTVVAAIAPSFGVILTGRVLQAVGTAIIMPLMMTLIMTVVPPQMRGTVMGSISIVLAVGPALGPTFAGSMMSIGTWHWVFWALVPFMALSGLFGFFRLKNVGENKSTPLDTVSLVFSALAFGGIVYGLSSIGVIVSGGEGAGIALALCVIGAVSLAVFLWRQHRLGEGALLNLRPFASRNYVLALFAMLCVHFALLGVANLLPLYLQGALLATALAAGLVNLPGGLLEAVVTPISGAIYDRFGPAPAIIPGSLLLTASIFWLSTVDDTTPIWLVMVKFAVLAFAIGFLLTPLMTTALSSLPKDVYSHGSAIVNTLLQVAGAAGTAVLVAVFSLVGEAGGNAPGAIADGTSRAFLIAGCVSLVGTVVVFFIKRPETAETTTTRISVDPQ